MQTHKRINVEFQDGDGITPHKRTELMSTRTRGGFRLIYPSRDPSPTATDTLAYVIDHGRQGGYDYTVITRRMSERMDQHQFQRHLKPRTDAIDPPQEWAEEAWAAWTSDRVLGVQRYLRRLTSDLKESRNEVIA